MNTNQYMRLRILLTFWFSFLLTVGYIAAQSCGFSDTLFINANTSNSLNLTITDFLNDDLAAPDQALCGIELNFVHQYVENLELTLVSPAGQRVELIGPNSDDQFDFTLFTQWRINFVPCGEMAFPDFPFAPQWDNEQTSDWATGGLYTGSYYPFSGCLEDFDTGPVNGTWTIEINNDPSLYPGAITYARLIFCDDSGVNCCFADAGELINPDILSCVGADTLLLMPEVEFRFGEYDTATYGYTFLLARDDILINQDSSTNIDLRSAEVGRYELCGLAYERTDQAFLPQPDGTLLLSSIQSDLASLTPTFCGELTPRCQIIEIVAPPDTTRLQERICLGDSVVVGDQAFFSTNRYTIPLTSYAGCDSIVTLDLFTQPALFTRIDSTICAEDSIELGGRFLDQTGLYRDTFPTAELACDSIVELNLTVLSDEPTILSPILCAGEAYIVGDSVFTTTGNYQVLLQSSQGCDSLVQIGLTVLSPDITINGFDTINCERTALLLEATSSLSSAERNIRWLDATGQEIIEADNLFISEGGTYIAELTQINNGISCLITDTIEVNDIRNAIVADAGSTSMLDCSTTQVELGGINTTIGPDLRYQWSVVNGGPLATSTTSRLTNTRLSGTYQLIVQDTISRCADTSMVTIEQDTIKPFLELSPVSALNCQLPLDTIRGTSSQIIDRQFTWSGPCIDEVLVDTSIVVSCAGTYVLEVLDTSNGCSSTDSVELVSTVRRPIANIAIGDTLDCSTSLVTLQASNLDTATNLQYTWSGPSLLSPLSTSSIQVTEGGTYSLILEDINNACRDTTSVVVVQDTLRPDAGTLTSDTINCAQDVATIVAEAHDTGPNYTYRWEDGNGTIFGQGFSTVMVSNSSRYSFIVTDENNTCQDTSSIQVQSDFTPPPLINAGPNQTLECGKPIVELQPDSIVLANSSIVWDGPCIEGEPDNRWAVSVSCEGLYTLTITNNISQCTGTDTVRVTQVDDYVVAQTPDTVSLSCENGTGFIPTTGSSVGQYRWLRNGVPINLPNMDPPIGSPGIYQLIIDNRIGACSDTSTTVVRFNCNVAAIVASPGELTCGIPSVVLDGTASSGNGPITYEWIAPDECVITPTDMPSIEVICAGTYQLVVYQPITGERDTATVTVRTDNSLPMVEVPNLVSLDCRTNSSLIEAVVPDDPNSYSFTWRDELENELGTGPTYTVSEAAFLILEVIDQQTRCSRTSFIQVVEDDNAPRISLGSTVFPCSADSFLLQTFVSPQNAEYTYNWDGPALLSNQDSLQASISQPGVYTLTVENLNNGCRSSESFDITAQSCAPCLNLASLDTLSCAIEEVMLTAEFCGPCNNCTLQWSVDDNPIMDANTLNLLVQSPGVYQLTAVDSEGLTTSVRSSVIRLAELTSIDLGPDRFLTCDSTNVHLQPDRIPGQTPINFAWYLLPTDDFLDNTSALTVSVEGSYRLEITNTFTGCTVSDTIDVQENIVSPIAEAGPPQQIDCQTGRAILDGSESTFLEATYLWTGGDTGCITNETTVNPVVSCEGTYYITVRDAQTGCTAIDSVLVTQAAIPPPIMPIGDTLINCEIPSIILLGNLPDEALDYQPNWCEVDTDGNVVLASCNTGLTLEISTPGRFQFQLTDPNTGCVNNQFVSVGIDTLAPQVNAGVNDTLFCTLTELMLQGNSSITESVEWSNPDGLTIDNLSSLSPTVYAPGIYRITATNRGNGCTSTDSVEIIRDINTPELIIPQDTSLNCEQRSLRLNASGETNSGALEWLWTASASQPIVNADSPTPIISEAGIYTVQLRDPVNDCSVSATVTVEENFANPTANIIGLDNLLLNCTQDTAYLDANMSLPANMDGLSYRWSTRGVGQLQSPLDGPTTVAMGVGLYRLIVTDNQNTCKDTLDFALSGDFQVPTFNILQPDLLGCSDDSVDLVVTHDIDAPLTFEWSTMALMPLSNDSLTIARLPGWYQVEVTDPVNGCSAVDSILVMQTVDVPQVSIASPSSLSCDNPVVALQGQIVNANSNIQYQWLPAGDLSVLGEGTNLLDSTKLSGFYTLLATDTVSLCSGQATVEVMESGMLIQGLRFTIDSPPCGQLLSDGAISVDSVLGGTPPYLYALNDNPLQGISFFDGLALGTYDLLVTDTEGCQWEETLVINATNPLTLDLGNDLTVQLGDSVQLNSQTNRDVTSYVWSALQSLTGMAPWLQPQKSQFVILTVEDENGCLATDTLWLQVEATLPYFAPTAFSPNGDNNNDRFTLFADNTVNRIIQMQIFDRWGSMVFEGLDIQPNSPGVGWDGTLGGQALNAGVYVYLAVIELTNGQTRQVSGEVMLVK